MNSRTLPIALTIIGWMLVAGGSITLLMTPVSWYHFELWRSIALVVSKLGSIVAGFGLLRARRYGAYLYRFVVAAMTALCYLLPPDIPGVEKYFTPASIAMTTAVPVVISAVLIKNWKALN